MLLVGSKAGTGEQGTVHTHVLSMPDSSYHSCLGKISSIWHHFRAGREGRMGGDLLGSRAQASAAWMCIRGKL